jgi:hypothetical protein
MENYWPTTNQVLTDYTGATKKYIAIFITMNLSGTYPAFMRLGQHMHPL